MKLSVPKIAKRHGCSEQTLYAVMRGDRPGRGVKIRAAVKEMEEIANRAFKNA